VSDVRMMRGFFVMPTFMMFGSFAVMLCRMLVVFGSLEVMISQLRVDHRLSPLPREGASLVRREDSSMTLYRRCIFAKWRFALQRMVHGRFHLPVTNLPKDPICHHRRTFMSDVALPGLIEPAARKGPDLDRGFPPLLSGIIFVGIIGAALLFVAYSIMADVEATGTKVTAFLPFIMLFVALLIALGFEFVNGFHDTANAVATVIYTRSLPAHIAVVWSGLFNLFGVLLSTGAVAFGIVSLLPVELILQVGSSAGFAMVFALLIAAIIWNVGTWYFGLPASSSHTLIGSIIGVGITNALLHGRDGTSGVDWSQATNIGYALLLSHSYWRRSCSWF
jgi:Phosphate transporter family